MPRTDNAVAYASHAWEWDPSHFPKPLSPAFASVYPRWMHDGFTATFADFGVLAATVDLRTRRGYLFLHSRPAGIPITPPAPIARLGLRLWRFHPTLRPRIRRAVRRIREDYPGRVLERWQSEWRPQIVREHAALRALYLDTLDDAALAKLLAWLVKRTGEWVTAHFILHAAIAIRIHRLENWLSARPDAGDISVAALLQGASTASSAPSRALRHLAATLRETADVLGRVDPDPVRALRQFQDASPAFAAELERYLDAHGDGIIGRYEFSLPALREQPWALVPALLHAARTRMPEPGEASDATEEPAVQRVVGHLSEAEALVFRTLVDAARHAYAQRDDNVHLTFNAAFGHVRRLLLAAGGRLHARGRLDAPEDVIWLRVQETMALLRGDDREVRPLVARRAAAHADALQHPPPRLVGRRLPAVSFAALPPEAREVNESLIRYLRGIMAAPEDMPAAEEVPAAVGHDRPHRDVLRGLGAVAGSYEGVARVLHGEDDFHRLAPGEVLVCAMTSPAWAPVLPLAGALVTDHGGQLSHAAVIAREFGIPAVVATREATRRIPDGARIRIDGAAGTVELLDAAAAPSMTSEVTTP